MAFHHESEDLKPRRLTPKTRKWLLIAGGLLVAAIVAAIITAARLTPLLRSEVVRALEDRFDSDVEIKDLSLVWRPTLGLSAHGVVIRQKDSAGMPPLITARAMTIEMGLLGLFETPKHVHTVVLDGFEVNVPSQRNRQGSGEQTQAAAGQRSSQPGFLVDRIIADGTVLRIIPKDAAKEPLTFQLYRLRLQSVGPGRPMSYQATLSNPRPPGLIQARGGFGPWQRDQPSSTALSGVYTFQGADLSVFNGIAGVLSSQGSFNGVLARIEANGATDVPNFVVRTSGNPVHLQTQFHAVIDGTDGDTLLQPVNAQFLNSTLEARGGVVHQPGRDGKTVSLAVDVAGGRVEDILRLAVKGTPPLSGRVSFRTSFDLPPGARDVMDRLALNCSFSIASAHFTNISFQQKIDSMSERAQGNAEQAADPQRVVTNMNGKFTLKDGEVSFSALSFSVPGATVALTGAYGLRSEALDFSGTVSMDAKLSETITGFKSFLLKAIDPFFRNRNGRGALVPIKITGTRQHPSFGLDL